GDAQRRRPQRFANGKANEAGARIVSGNEQKDEEHHQELDADEHHADAHASIQRNFIDGIRLAAEAGKGRAGIGKCVYADAEPGHAIAAGNSQDAEQENHHHAEGVHMQQHAEVEHDDHGDEGLEQDQKLALRDQIGFAGVIDQLGNLAHGAVHRQILQALIDGQTKNQPEDAKKNPEKEELMTIDAEKVYLGEIGKL